MASRTRPHPLLFLVGLAAAVGLVLHVGHVTFGLGSSEAAHELLDEWVYNALMGGAAAACVVRGLLVRKDRGAWLDRKSTRLNSSHANISYAVFCLKKKKTILSLNIRTQMRNLSQHILILFLSNIDILTQC